MKQRHQKPQRDSSPPDPCEPIVETTVGSLDEGLTETFPASDPVSISVTRIDETGTECGTDGSTTSR